MGNIYCLPLNDNTVFDVNQPVSCFISTRSIDVIIYYESVTEAYDFASIVLEKYVGDKENKINTVISFNQLCNKLQTNSNEYITIDNNSLGNVCIYLGHYIHNDISLLNPKIYREKDVIRHYQRVGKIENFFI
jgi:hypothetical protein